MTSSLHVSMRPFFASLFLLSRVCVAIIVVVAGTPLLAAAEREWEVSLEPTQGILSSRFLVWTSSESIPSAVLVLCPGQNGDGAEFLAGREWKEFAVRHNLAIMVPHFVSNDGDLLAGKGYFRAELGSGHLLRLALKKCGWDNVPLLFYGFSGGAHFAMSFAAWQPERVLAFCAYSFAWWSPPPASLTCPALIVCGQADGVRYGSAFSYFQAGKREGKPWAWVSLEGQGHTPSVGLQSFVRDYFACVLKSSIREEVVVDNTTGNLLKDSPCDAITTSILPCGELHDPWRRIHHP